MNFKAQKTNFIIAENELFSFYPIFDFKLIFFSIFLVYNPINCQLFWFKIIFLNYFIVEIVLVAFFMNLFPEF